MTHALRQDDHPHLDAEAFGCSFFFDGASDLVSRAAVRGRVIDHHNVERLVIVGMLCRAQIGRVPVLELVDSLCGGRELLDGQPSRPVCQDGSIHRAKAERVGQLVGHRRWRGVRLAMPHYRNHLRPI